jgi:hypothetical protein
MTDEAFYNLDILGAGATLHVQGEALYITWDNGRDDHFHRLPLAVDEDCEDCWHLAAWHGVSPAQVAELHTAALQEPCLCTTYQVETKTWHPEWIATDETGHPYFTDAYYH